MSEGATKVAVDIVCSVDKPATGRTRVIAKDAEGNLYLLEEEPAGTFKRISRPVGMDLLERVAGAVLAGDPGALTWPDALKVLAIGCGTFLFYLRNPDQSLGPPAPAGPVAPPAADSEAPAGGAPSGAAP